MKKILLISLLIPSLLKAQEGVKFEHTLNWQQVQAKANAEHKYIFVDCYATWCGPCRYMSRTIFPQAAVADIMNAKFINVAVQLDTTNADNGQVKSWYQTGHDFAEKYHVKFLPTYLIFDENGKIIHRFSGASQTGDDFVKRINDGLNPDKQYYVLLEKYNAGNKDPEFIRTIAHAAQEAGDLERSSELANAYLATQQNPYTKDNIQFILFFTRSSKDKGFEILLNHGALIDSVSGQNISGDIVRNIILNENVSPLIFPRAVSDPKDLPEPDWNKLQSDLQQKYPAYSREIISYAQATFYMNKGDWTNFNPAVASYIKDYGSNVSGYQLNNFAWAVFLNCDDTAYLQKALEWSQRSLAKTQDPAFMDTYANLLYKLGRKDEALEWETKALTAARDNDKPAYEETLKKIKNGDKTWN